MAHYAKGQTIIGLHEVLINAEYTADQFLYSSAFLHSALSAKLFKKHGSFHECCHVRCLSVVYPRFDIFHSLGHFSFFFISALFDDSLVSDCLHQGLTPPFTKAPSDPTYVVVGSDARLEWNYDHGNVENIAIEYEKSGSFVALVAKDSKGSVQVNPQEPKSLTDRVTIEGNATLVIKAVNTGDSTKYRCWFTPVGGGSRTEGPVRLIVAGRYTTFLWQKSVHIHVQEITWPGQPSS